MVYKFSNLIRDKVAAMLEIELQQTRIDRQAKAQSLELGLRQEKALLFKQTACSKIRQDRP
jgi:hypothetical protein